MGKRGPKPRCGRTMTGAERTRLSRLPAQEKQLCEDRKQIPPRKPKTTVWPDHRYSSRATAYRAKK